MLLSDFPNKIATTCLQHFSKLPKSGKPVKGKEWTLLSAILISTTELTEPHVVAMATGSKCIGRSKLSANGDVLNDSHAEVLARRAFLRYLYHQMELVLDDQKSEILERSKDPKCFFCLKPGVKFHFYTSHTPCGDASIFPKVSPPKRKNEEEEEGLDSAKRFKSDNPVPVTDIYRTGAKCVEEGAQDPKGPGAEYHTLGALRTKPGRGDPTLSMSCSDKICKWNVCGLQGALLARLLQGPVYLDTVTVGKCPYCPEAMLRALVGRSAKVTNLPEGYCLNSPHIFQSSASFDCGRTPLEETSSNKIVPCSASIVWSNVKVKPLEVSVNGKRQGVTSKSVLKPSARLSTCKAQLFQTFCQLIHRICKDDTYTDKSYLQNKKLSVQYQQALGEFQKVFLNWTRKPENLLDFTLSSEQDNK